MPVQLTAKILDPLLRGILEVEPEKRLGCDLLGDVVVAGVVQTRSGNVHGPELT
jgi:hypothetical protein